MSDKSQNEYKTTQTAFASFIIFKTKCRHRLHRDGSKSTAIVLAISPAEAEVLESEFLSSEYHSCRSIERTLTDHIRQG